MEKKQEEKGRATGVRGKKYGRDKDNGVSVHLTLEL